MSAFMRCYRVRKGIVLLVLFLALGLFYTWQIAAAHFQERYVAVLSWVMANKLIVIDPGHGGIDPGVPGSTGVHEKDIVLSVAQKLAEILREAGTEVVLTRESDSDLSDPGLNLHAAKIQDLSRRIALANDRGADMFISIHVNSFPDPREDGAQTFYQPGSEESKKMSLAVQQEMNRYLANPGRKAKPVDYFLNRRAKMPSAIVEIGFITNPQEEKLLLDQQYQSKIAWAVYAGLVSYCAAQAPELPVSPSR